MSNTTVIDYEDSDGKGTVTLVANPFGKAESIMRGSTARR